VSSENDFLRNSSTREATSTPHDVSSMLARRWRRGLDLGLGPGLNGSMSEAFLRGPRVASTAHRGVQREDSNIKSTLGPSLAILANARERGRPKRIWAG
jgi:hypothetical protein